MLICTVNMADVANLWDVKAQVAYSDMEDVLIELRQKVWDGGIGTIMHGVAEMVGHEEFGP